MSADKAREDRTAHRRRVSLRGRKVVCKVHPGMRPTPQMVREALFSILGNAVPGRPFYDVFAGTGVVGLEAASRGASSGQPDREGSPSRSQEVAEATSSSSASTDRAFVIRADAYRWAERWVPPLEGGPVNLFLSPPFPDLARRQNSPQFLKLVDNLLAKAPGRLGADRSRPRTASRSRNCRRLELWDRRRYGRNHLYFRVKGEVRGEEIDGGSLGTARD